MKKRMAILLAAALLLGACAGMAEGEFEPYWAAVAVFGEAEGVSLQKEPDHDADALALVYGGTPVEVLSVTDGPGGERWAAVRVGHADAPEVTGYVPLKRLMTYNRNYGAPSLFRTAEVKNRAALLREQTDESAPGLRTRDRLYLLADMGGGWLLAAEDDSLQRAGYIRTEELESFRMDVTAFVFPDRGEKATVYRDKALSEPIGSFYAGVMTGVTDYSQEEGWAKVEGFGLWGGMSWDMNWELRGYISPDDLLVFTQTWDVDYQMPTGILLEDAVDQNGHELPEGSAVTIIGEMNGRIQIVSYDWEIMDDIALAVAPEDIEITDRPADNRGPARLGYAFWPDGQAYGGNEWILMGNEPNDSLPGDFDGCLSEVLGEEDGWYQLRCYERKNYWSPKAGAGYIAEADLIPERTESKGPGGWIAEAMDQGLWYMRVDAGQDAKLTLQKPGGETERYIAEKSEEARYYTVYVTPGTRVTLEGTGEMIPLNGEKPPVLVARDKRDVPEDEALFSGSGRYFCDTQIAIDNLGAFSYYIVPVDESRESWFTVSDLVSPGTRTELSYPGNGQWPDDDEMAWWEQQGSFVDMYPGQFLELHHCVLYVFYGNG